VRAVGEHNVALAGEALLRQLGGANSDGTTAGEAQVDDGAVACGEVGERGPKWLLEHGDVTAEERNREPWLRWQTLPLLVPYQETVMQKDE
jgi:hypothetical protein